MKMVFVESIRFCPSSFNVIRSIFVIVENIEVTFASNEIEGYENISYSSHLISLSNYNW